MKLIYVMDPMCSWCWGFRNKFQELLGGLPNNVPIQYIMGGLAPDSDEPMPEPTKAYIQSQWRAVTEATGAQFNWDFWQQCKPRRSTYPACRAVLAAGVSDINFKPKMILAIQRAYYEQARNPSDTGTLVDLAGEIGLDQAIFSEHISSNQVAQLLQEDLSMTKSLGVRSFPTLLIQHHNKYHWLADSQTNISDMLGIIEDINSA